jgi:O-antigen/teichoic acid export membrane protein
LKTAAPIGVAMLFTALYQQGAVVLLPLLANTEAAGLFSAAQRPAIFLQGFAVILGESLLPTFVRLPDSRALGRFAAAVTAATVALALPLGVSATLGAEALVTLLYGPAFSAAGIVLALLTWQAVAVLLNVPFYTTLLARGRERHFLAAVALGAVVNLTLNAIAIPRYGAAGAGLVLLGTEILVLALLIRWSADAMAQGPGWHSLGIAGAVLTASLAVGLLAPGPALLRGFMSAAAGWAVGALYLRAPLIALLRAGA